MDAMKMYRIFLCPFIFVILLNSQITDSKYIEGHLNTKEDWEFLARFCFLSDRGRLQFEFEYPQKNYEPQNILLYYDEADQWPAVYKTGLTCVEKEAVLHIENHQVINLTNKYGPSGCELVPVGDENILECSGSRSFRSARERWWYIAVSHCDNAKTCQEKEAKLKPQNNQIIYLSLFYAWSGCKLFNQTGVPTYTCKGGRSFVSARERWWYIAASHCNNPQGLNLKYRMWMWNGEEGDLFFRQFSADEFYILQTDMCYLLFFFIIFLISIWVSDILQTDIAFLLVFLFMFILSIVCAVVLRSRQLFHTTYKLYMTSLVCQVLYLLIMCINYGKYANDGIEDRGLETFGRIFEAASMLIFLLMLILMGKGYTITRGRLSTSGSIKIAVFMTLYTITFIVLFIYEAVFFDPGEVLYLYESPPGYGLIGLRLVAWIWFCYAIFFTLKHYPEKSSFYYPFFVFYTIWFLAMPAFVLIAYFAIPKWTREKIVNGIVLTIAFFAYTFFLFLTRPTAANRNFPYHVRTSQIGVMNGPPTQNGVPLTASPFTESFAPHPYAPSADPPPSYYNATNGAANFNDLFTVSQSRSQKQNGNVDRYPHAPPGNNPFIVTK